jgi:hypothetical protein
LPPPIELLRILLAGTRMAGRKRLSRVERGSGCSRGPSDRRAAASSARVGASPLPMGPSPVCALGTRASPRCHAAKAMGTGSPTSRSSWRSRDPASPALRARIRVSWRARVKAMDLGVRESALCGWEAFLACAAGVGDTCPRSGVEGRDRHRGSSPTLAEPWISASIGLGLRPWSPDRRDMVPEGARVRRARSKNCKFTCGSASRYTAARQVPGAIVGLPVEPCLRRK